MENNLVGSQIRSIGWHLALFLLVYLVALLFFGIVGFVTYPNAGRVAQIGVAGAVGSVFGTLSFRKFVSSRKLQSRAIHHDKKSLLVDVGPIYVTLVTAIFALLPPFLAGDFASFPLPWKYTRGALTFIAFLAIVMMAKHLRKRR